MNKDNHDIEQIIAKASFRELSNEEQSLVWSRIESKSHKKLSFLIIKKPMLASIIVALALALGVGGTVVTADNAGPGDALFGVDQAVEKVRITLASPEKKNDLRIQFAGERMKEVEHLSPQTPAMTRPAAADVTETSVTKIEADVFQNETVIKIEYGVSKKFVFTTNIKTKPEIVAEIMKNFTGLSKTFVETKIIFQIEDRQSRPEDKGVVVNNNTKVTAGLNAALTLLNGVSTSLNTDEAAKLKAITDQLNAYLVTMPKDTSVQGTIKNDDQKTRVDLRTEDGRVRVEIKNGELRIKTDSKKEDDHEDRISNSSSGKSDSRGEYSNKGRDHDDDEDEGEDDDDDRGTVVNTPPVVVTPPSGTTTTTAYTLADVKLHNTKTSCWTAVMGSVYDVTPWISQHPGGSSTIIGMCGIDASAAYNGQHGGASRPASELASFKIGVLK